MDETTALVATEPEPESLPAFPDLSDDDAEPEGEAAREEPLIRCRAKLKKVDITDASNGPTYKLQLEVDPPHAEAFIYLMGDSTYEFVWSGLLIGIGLIKGVNTTDADQMPRTIIALQFSQDQIPRAQPLPVCVGRTEPLQVYSMQMAFDLTTKAE